MNLAGIAGAQQDPAVSPHSPRQRFSPCDGAGSRDDIGL